VSAWINPRVVPSSGGVTVISQGTAGEAFNYGVVVNSNHLCARNSNWDWNLGGTVVPNAWQHLTIVWEGIGGATGYINGRNVGSNVSGVTTNSDNADLVFGAYAVNSPSTELFNGVMDDVRIYPFRAFSDAEVFRSYQNSLLGYPGLLNRLDTSSYAAGGTGRVRHRSTLY
jgi:hypothetical protein